MIAVQKELREAAEPQEVSELHAVTNGCQLESEGWDQTLGLRGQWRTRKMMLEQEGWPGYAADFFEPVSSEYGNFHLTATRCFQLLQC